jgi:hypothetical protein
MWKGRHVDGALQCLFAYLVDVPQGLGAAHALAVFANDDDRGGFQRCSDVFDDIGGHVGGSACDSFQQCTHAREGSDDGDVNESIGVFGHLATQEVVPR